jgi:hypothetical protein
MDFSVAQMCTGPKESRRAGFWCTPQQRTPAGGEAKRQSAPIIIRRFSGNEALFDQAAHDDADRADVGVRAVRELGE